MLRIYKKSIVAAKSSLPNGSKFDVGYSLVEVLVVVLMIGILAAIAAPGWLAFVNRQRVNKANDGVLSAIQQAQQQAKQTKLSYSVSFRNKNLVPQYVVYPAVDYNSNTIAVSSVSDSRWKTLGDSLSLQPGQVLLYTNIDTPNNINSSSSVTDTLPGVGTEKTITFDYTGALPSNANLGGSVGLKVVVSVPASGGNTRTGAQRCVIIRTLLGSMKTGIGPNACQ